MRSSRSSLRLLASALALACGACASAPPPPKRVEPLPAKLFPVPAGDVRLHVRAVGGRVGGPTLIVLHGGPGLSHEYTEPFEHLASRELRVVTFDQRGMGQSTRPPPGALSLNHYLGDIEAVRTFFKVAQVTLVGHAWGGLLAQAYAAAHPERVRALVLVDSMPNSEARLEEALQRVQQREQMLVQEGLISARLPEPEGDDCRKAVFARLPAEFADARHPLTRDLGGATRCSESVLEGTMQALGSFDLGPRIEALTLPVLVIAGAEDPAGPAATEELVALLPQARVQKVLLPACGHYPFLECPDAFFPYVESFLAGVR